MTPSTLSRWLFLAVSVTAACTGQISGSSPSPSGAGAGDALAPDGKAAPPGPAAGGAAPPAPPADTPIPASPSGLRRLSRAELDATLKDLLLDDSAPAARRLPEENLDVRFAFDNDQVANRDASLSYVEALEAIVTDAVHAAITDDKRRAQVLPCTPKDAADSACFRSVVAKFGRRALRRPLEAEETALYEGFFSLAKDGGSVNLAVEAALRAMLTAPEFIYRFEVGAPVSPGSDVHRLSAYEVASRLSYTLLGTTPDDALLDAAAAGKLDTDAGRRAAATAMLKDPRARARVHHFYAYWLGYSRGLPAGLGAALIEETNALIDDVVFAQPRDHREIFLSARTFIGDTLRKHYADVGAPLKGTAGWVDYGKSGRRGILSHGSVLSAFRTGEDTSITKRGLFVRLRLLCDEIPDPPPNVAVDVTAAATECKTGPSGFYAKSHQGAACKGCHERMDPIGFGLEAFDATGRARTYDEGKPQCGIDGKGTLLIDGASTPFEGPAGLAQAVVSSGRLDGCLMRHVYRFALGRRDRADDEPLLAALTQSFVAGGRDFGRALVELVAHPSFALRRVVP